MLDNQNTRRSVAVVGATGHTGRFVVAELERRGISPIAIARDGHALAATFENRGTAFHAAELEDSDLLDRALSGSDAVINCAGPFLDTATAVASAALRAGIHYVDVAAEQFITAETLNKFDQPAREANVAVIPAMGFFGGFADLLATAALADWDEVDSIDIAIGLDSWHPTRGTRITGARNTAQRLVVSGGGLSPLPLPPAEKRWEFGAPLGTHTVAELPFPEIILLSRHVQAREIHTYLSTAALADIRNPETPAPKPADGSGRSSQLFAVEAIVKRGNQTRRAVARGRDIYAFTAPLVCEVTSRLLQGSFRRPGAHAPGAILDAIEVLEALSSENIAIDMTQFSRPEFSV